MTINVLGVELEMDVYDVDVFEKFEHEVVEVKNKVDEAENEKTNVQKLRRQCAIVKEFFDNVFGPGTSDKVFKGKDNIKDCTDAYIIVISAFSEAVHTYGEAMESSHDEIMSKYAPWPEDDEVEDDEVEVDEV